MPQPTLPNWRLPCYRYGIICHRSSLIRQSCHFERNSEVFDFVLLQLADILNTQFKYRDGSWHSLLKRLKYLRKSCAKFDSLLRKNCWICSMQLHVHLKKWTSKFKLLYLLNPMCYFHKICRICGLNPQLLPLQIWWIPEIYNFSYRFTFLACPVYSKYLLGHSEYNSHILVMNFALFSTICNISAQLQLFTSMKCCVM